MVRRFLLKDVGRALNHWTGLWRERQRFKLIGRRMGFDGGLSRAWRQWEHQAADDQRRKGIIGRFANVGLTRALNRWLESLEERRLMRHFLKRAMNGGLARALTSWYETMHQGALPPPLGLRARLEGVPPRRSGRGASSKVWKGPPRRSGRGASSKVWKGCLLRSSFIRQSARAAACRARSRPPRTAPPAFSPPRTAKKDHARLARFGAKFLKLRELRAWNCWLGLLEERARLKVVARRMMQVGVVRAINQWCAYLDGQER